MKDPEWNGLHCTCGAGAFDDEQHKPACSVSIIGALVKQLKQDNYELATLSARLTPQFRASVERVRENIAKALAVAGERP